MGRRNGCVLLALFLSACGGPDADPMPLTGTAAEAEQDEAKERAAPELRVATFNVSLFHPEPRGLIGHLQGPRSDQLSAITAIITEVDPDILIVNEFDHDEGGEAIGIFSGLLGYPHAVSLASNTGVATGLDLDGDGRSDHPLGTRDYGNDAFGYGVHPGQYAIALLSKHPIEEGAIRTFREFLWRDLPGNLMPTEHYGEDAQAILRLSSKTHADIPVKVAGRTLHVIVAHPTPPGFDGPEDRNGRRNHDEIRLLTEYVGGEPVPWLVDDRGQRGGLDPQASFVIGGDLNADPVDGDLVEGTGRHAIVDLLDHPRTADPGPVSAGGPDAARRQGNANLRQSGDPALDTADFQDNRVGNLRVDYVLPSSDLEVLGSGVYWPAEGDPGFEHTGYGFPPTSSDHRLVWVDLRFPSD